MLVRLVVLAVATTAIWSWLRRRGGQPSDGEGEERQAQLEAGTAAPFAGEAKAPARSAQTATAEPGTDTAATIPAGNAQPSAATATPPQSTQAAAAPAADRSGAATQPAAGAPAQERRIKGNIRGNEKLYHLPDDQTYDQVIEERLFATREEAEAEGYRHAQQPG